MRTSFSERRGEPTSDTKPRRYRSCSAITHQEAVLYKVRDACVTNMIEGLLSIRYGVSSASLFLGTRSFMSSQLYSRGKLRFRHCFSLYASETS